MAVFGFSVSIAIIAIGGGFSSPVSIFTPPTSANLWTIGKTIQSGTVLNYSLTRIGSHPSPWSSLGGHGSLVNSSVGMKFLEDRYNNKDQNVWKVLLDVINGTNGNAETTQHSRIKSDGV